MRYTAKYFRDRLPDWKRKKDPILSRVFYRPLSFFCSAFFSYIGWTANMVSYFSAVVAIIACACFVLGAPIVGAVLINLWLLLDCTDGNIARSVKKERYGDFADSNEQLHLRGVHVPVAGASNHSQCCSRASSTGSTWSWFGGLPTTG